MDIRRVSLIGVNYRSLDLHWKRLLCGWAGTAFRPVLYRTLAYETRTERALQKIFGRPAAYFRIAI